MFGLFSARQTASTSAHRRTYARPNLEALESRWVPSGNSPGDPGEGPPPATTPTLTINVEYNWSTVVTLHGTLSGVPVISGVTINLSGKVSGVTSTDVSGNYSITLAATGLGRVDAEAVGTGATAYEELWDVAPEITSFLASEGANNVWTLSGTVAYHRAFDTLTINFGGVPVSIIGQSTTADNSGSFELLVTLNGTASDNGLAWAQAVSPWGLLSDKAYQTIQQSGT